MALHIEYYKGDSGGFPQVQVFTFGLAVESIKELGGASLHMVHKLILIIWNHNV
jgi:hypothetical protein